MKKVLLMMFALICFGATAKAQVCKISGANDGSTIMCTGEHLENDKVIVNLSNDSENTCANVTVIVEVTYSNNSMNEDKIITQKFHQNEITEE